jgi:hypothetical protein
LARARDSRFLSAGVFGLSPDSGLPILLTVPVKYVLQVLQYQRWTPVGRLPFFTVLVDAHFGSGQFIS